MEVIAGVSAIVQVIESVTRVTKRLKELRESYNNVALNTTLVESRLLTIQAALVALHEWRANDPESSRPSKQLDNDLGMSLNCCAILISVINKKLDESSHKHGLKQKIEYLCSEDILKEYISNLEGQVRALQLLLIVFQCRTETEKRKELEKEENRTIMQQVRAETASLAKNTKDFQETASILSLDPSVTFNVDSILMESPVYKRVYGNARLRLPHVSRASPTEISEEAARPAPTPFSNQTHQQPSPLPLRPAQNLMPQSRHRINAWDYYFDETEENKDAKGTSMAGSNEVFELPGDTHGSRVASQRAKKSKEVHDSKLQYDVTVIDRVDEDMKTTGVESSMDSVSEGRPLWIQTGRVMTTAPLAAIDDTKPISFLKRFEDQLNLSFGEKILSLENDRDVGPLFGTRVLLRAEENYTIAPQRDEASQAISRKGSKEVQGHSSKPQTEDLDLTPSRRKGSAEESRSTSTHPSLDGCSIIPKRQDQSTGTSSAYSCVSSKKLGVTDNNSGNDLSKVERDDLDRSSLQSDSKSANLQPSATHKSPIVIEVQCQRQQNALSAITNKSQYQPSTDVLPLVPYSTTIEQHRHNEALTICSTEPVNNMVKSKIQNLKRVEGSRPVAGLGLQRTESSEPSGTYSEKSEEPCLERHLPEQVASGNPLASFTPPAILGYPLDAPRTPESKQSTFCSDRRSSPHDVTSTRSSSEPPEDSTISSLQHSTSNTTATILSTHAPGLDPDQNLPDLSRLQNELVTARARGDSRAEIDVLRRSIQAVNPSRLAVAPAEEMSTSNQSCVLRLSGARSNNMHFSSRLGSTKGVMLGDLAASGNTSLVQDLLKERVNVDSRSDNSKTPLMRAAMNGHINCLKALKQYGADEAAIDAKGRTALHIAVASNQLAVVNWLLESYPPPNFEMLRYRRTALSRATDVVRGVRSQKNLRETSDAEGSKQLHIAAELSQGDMVETLVAAGVDLESKDNSGRTPLHRAIVSKSRDSFDTLIRSGAQVAAVDAKSISSLHLAAEAGQVDVMKILLANGAKRWEFDTEGNQAIHFAVSGGNILAIEALVTERTDLEKRTRGQTLLHLACLKKNLKVVTYLLKKLVDVNPWATPASGVLQALSRTKIKGSSMTPLHYACCVRDYEMAVILLDHKAWINAPTPEGSTALMMAVEAEDTDMVNLLLQRGAKVNAKLPGSLITALHLAARRGDLETVRLLCRNGADFNAQESSSSYYKRPLEECSKCLDRKKGLAVREYLRKIAYESQARTVLHNVAQQARAKAPQYCDLNFNVPDEMSPAYEPGTVVPARLAKEASVHRGL